MKKILFFFVLVLPFLSVAQEIRIITPENHFRFETRIPVYREPKNSFSIFPRSLSKSINRVFDRMFDWNKRRGNYYYGRFQDRNGIEILIHPESPRIEIEREIIEKIRNNIRKARGVRI